MCQCLQAKQPDQCSPDHRDVPCSEIAYVQLPDASFSDKTSSPPSTAARTRCLACTPISCTSCQIQVCCMYSMLWSTTWVRHIYNLWVCQALERLHKAICSHSVKSLLLVQVRTAQGKWVLTTWGRYLCSTWAKFYVRQRWCMSKGTYIIIPV